MSERKTENEMADPIPAEVNGRTPFTVRVKKSPRAHGTVIFVRYHENIGEAYASAEKMVAKEFPKGKLLTVAPYTGPTSA